MARPDLISALKNALERGESIQQAKLSLISSGYLQSEVEEAALALTQGSIRQKAELENLTAPARPLRPLFPSKPVPPKLQIAETESPVESEMPKPIKPAKKKGVPWFIILLLILLGLVGYIIFMLIRRLSL